MPTPSVSIHYWMENVMYLGGIFIAAFWKCNVYTRVFIWNNVNYTVHGLWTIPQVNYSVTNNDSASISLTADIYASRFVQNILIQQYTKNFYRIPLARFTRYTANLEIISCTMQYYTKSPTNLYLYYFGRFICYTQQTVFKLHARNWIISMYIENFLLWPLISMQLK